MSSFESMAPTLKPADWSPHAAAMLPPPPSPPLTSRWRVCSVQMIFAGNFACDTCRMYERNYPCDSLIAVYFGVLFPASPPASPSLLQRFTYLCMMAQVHTLPSLQPFRLLLMCALTRGPQSDAGDEERH